MWQTVLIISAFLLPLPALACQTGNVYTDIECHEKQTRQIQTKMNRAYADLVKLYMYDAHKAFTQSQKLWLQWIKKDCAFESAPYRQSQGAGSGLALASCTHEKYAARLKQLETIIHELRTDKAE
ncbi:lysozyme inhibitor LprI family protein [Neisseria sp.]|uniref:lysozyme inhibitor LprI family protein n=1 Tax=Neisseria sp. TaxID=192066 RepID=UPI0035A1B040